MKDPLYKTFWAFFCTLIVLTSHACKDGDKPASQSDARIDSVTSSIDEASDSGSTGSEESSESLMADASETIDDEASREFGNFLSLHLMEGQNDSHLFVKVPMKKDKRLESLSGFDIPIYAMPKVYEVNKLTYSCYPFTVTEADKLNHIEWRGEGDIYGNAFRWKNVGGAWSEWKDLDDSPIKPFSIKKKNNIWIFDDTDNDADIHMPRIIDLQSDTEFISNIKNILVDGEWSVGANYFGKFAMNESGEFKVDVFDEQRKRQIITNGEWQINDHNKIVFKYIDKDVVHQDEYKVESAGINNLKLALVASGDSILPKELELLKDLRLTDYYASLSSTITAKHLNETDAYRSLILPNNLRIKVPNNWVPTSEDWNQTIAANTQAVIDLSGVELPVTGDQLIYRSTSRPTSTYASLTVYAGPKEFDPEELKNPSEDEIIEATSVLKEITKKLLAVNGYEIKEFKPVSIVNIDGKVGLVTQYIRNGNKGDVSVWSVRLIADDFEITVQMAHRISEEKIWMPIIQYMKESMSIEK